MAQDQNDRGPARLQEDRQNRTQLFHDKSVWRLGGLVTTQGLTSSQRLYLRSCFLSHGQGLRSRRALRAAALSGRLRASRLDLFSNDSFTVQPSGFGRVSSEETFDHWPGRLPCLAATLLDRRAFADRIAEGPVTAFERPVGPGLAILQKLFVLAR